MLWAETTTGRAMPSPKGRGVCPGCGGEVLAKCGEHVSWHWAHVASDCDPWSEPESTWHRRWKQMFPPEWQERQIGAHRADVLTPHGGIEFQRSSISSTEIREREDFYGRMIWVIDATRYRMEEEENISEMLRRFRASLNEPPYPGLFDLLSNPRVVEIANSSQASQKRDELFKAFILRERESRKRTTFRWYWPAKSWKAARKTIFLDFGRSRLGRVTAFRWPSSGRCYFDVKWMDKKAFISACS